MARGLHRPPGVPLPAADLSKAASDRPAFLAPGLAVLLFVAARSLFGWSESPGPSAAGLSADAAPTRRTTAAIPSLEARRAQARRLPQTESELIELLRRDGSVLFSADDSDSGPGQVFSLEEVGVIVVPAPE